MGVFDGLLGPAVTQAANARTAYIGGQRQGQQDRLAQAMQLLALKRQQANDQLKQALGARTLRTPVLGDPSYAKAQGDVAGAQASARVPAAVDEARQVAPIKTQQSVDEASAMIPVHVREQMAQIPGKVQEQNAMTPGAVNRAVATARGEAPIKTQQAIDEARGTYDYKTPLGAVDPKTGETEFMRPSEALGKNKPAAGGGAGGERSGMAAAFLSRLKMGQADFENGMQFIKDYHKKLVTGQEKITPTMMAEKATAEVGQNPEAHGMTGAINNALGGFTQGLANTRLASTHADYQRYINLLNSMSLAMTEVLPRPTQQLLGIERGINTAKAGDPPERIADIQHRLDKAYEYLFANPEGMLQRGPALGKAPTQAVTGSPASRAQQLWDAAVAKHGEAKVLQEFGPRPPE